MMILFFDTNTFGEDNSDDEDGDDDIREKQH